MQVGPATKRCNIWKIYLEEVKKKGFFLHCIKEENVGVARNWIYDWLGRVQILRNFVSSLMSATAARILMKTQM